MSLYLDASVIVPLFIREASSDTVRAFVAEQDASLCISSYAAGEFASAVSRLVRMGLMATGDAQTRLALFDDWRDTDATGVMIENGDIRRATDIVRRFEHKLLMPDAVHAALCERHDFTLTTLDKRLAEAAERLGISSIVPA